MLTTIQSLILGIVEGFTEFLPISSTAHLGLVSDFLNISQSNYLKTFQVSIQSGAILAVVFLYWRKFLNPGTLKKVIVAFIPTAVVGFIFYDLIKTYFIGNTPVILSALALGGLFLIIFEKKHTPKNRETISLRQSFLIGLVQSIAIIPGISRAAATIVGGLSLGISRTAIVEFSFLLAVPTLLGATTLDLYNNLYLFSQDQMALLLTGFFSSFVMAIVSIKFLLAYIRTHTFIGFGIYRVIAAIIFILIL